MATKRKVTRKSRTPLAGQARRRFERRWLELTGERYRPSLRIPPTLVSSLSSLAFVPKRFPKIVKMRWPFPQVVVVARKHEGKDCDEKAEIGGWYSCEHNGQCIGRAAVLKILNAAASKLCSKTLHCPSRCPCTYVPRKALAAYECTATLEEGYLMQAVEEWNCFCFAE
jgi:hypothetical protein